MDISTLVLIWCGLLGLVLGSFLNVVIYRLPRKCMTIFGARSLCPHCLKTIAWYDNIPVISYLMLAGKCRHCKKPISPGYMMVEIITGGFVFLLGHRFLVNWDVGGVFADTWPLFIIYAVFVCALIAVTFIDIRLRIIPNEISIGGILIAPVVSFFYPALHQQGLANFPWREQVMRLPWGENLVGLFSSLMGMLVGAAIIYVVAVLGRILFRKEAMGGGDLKLLAMMGAVIGWQGTIVVFLVACLVGAIFGVLVILITKEHYMPFGPYLALGAVIYLFLGDLLVKGYYWYTGLLQGV
ncbi:MAG: prepilin peptidase [Planctomycetota bacterium]